MNQAFLNREVSYEDLQKGIIASNFENTDDILKSEQELKFIDDIRKGEVDVITTEDLKEDFNDKYYTASGIAKCEQAMEALIKKGEDDHLTEEEYESLTKGREDIDRLERKAVAIKKGDVDGYAEIFVEPKSEDEGEDGDGDGGAE